MAHLIAKRVRAERRGSSVGSLKRWILGLIWSLKPPRLYGVPATVSLLAKYYAGLGPLVSCPILRTPCANPMGLPESAPT
jgi:hypothetical protein